MDDNEPKRRLQATIETIRVTLDKRADHGHPITSEADTERNIIEPILEALGYEKWEFIQHKTDAVTKGVPDYEVFYGKDLCWILEAKRLGLPLQDGEAAQAVNYANNQGAEWAVLTNGPTWYIYNAHLPKPLTEKRVMQIGNLFSDSDALEKLLLLSRQSMQTSGLTDAWTHQRVVAMVKSQLETPNSAIRKRLCDIGREEIGMALDDAAIAGAIAAFGMIGIQETTPNDDAPPATPPANATIPPIPRPLPASVKPHAGWYTFEELAGDKTLTSSTKSMPKKRLKILEFSDGHREEVDYWLDVARVVVEWVSQRYKLPSLPFNVSSGRNTKNYFLNSEPVQSDGEKMENPREIEVDRKTVYVDIKKDAWHITMNLAHLLAVVGAPPDAIKIRLPR